MEHEFNFYWGILGFLGILGYILENPNYYIFFTFFLLTLVPFLNKRMKNRKYSKNIHKSNDNEPNSLDFNKIIIWVGSCLIIIVSLILMIFKTFNDLIAIALLLGVLLFITNFFNYMGIEKPGEDERLRKIGALSTMYSWYVTMVFLSFLLITSFWSGVQRTSVELL